MGTLSIESVEAQGVNTDYISELNKAGDILGGIEEGGMGSKGYDGLAELGIDANKVEGMKGAIETYVQGLENKIKEINGLVDESAFYGAYAQGIAGYVDAIAYGCKVIVGKLRSFKADLDKIKTAYSDFDTNLNSTLEGQQEELNSSFASIEYQEEGATGEGATPEGN